MAKIFMSFIHEEASVASTVKIFTHRILGHSVDTFMSSDKNAIYAGEDWMARVFEELESAKVLLSLLSPSSVGRPWINFEAGAAWMGRAKVIPVCFGGLTVSALPKPYSSLQAVEIDTPEGAYYLWSSIAHHLSIDPPQRPMFSAGLPSWTDAEKEENQKLCRTYTTFNSAVRLMLDATRHDV